MVLREIEATVRSAVRDERQNRTFAERQKTADNRDTKKTTERSDEHGTDLQTGGRLPSSEPRSAGEPKDREIWDASVPVSARPKESDIQRDADVRQQSMRLAAALIGTLSPLDQQPVFLPTDLLADPFHPVLFLEPSSAYRADRIFIAPY